MASTQTDFYSTKVTDIDNSDDVTSSFIETKSFDDAKVFSANDIEEQAITDSVRQIISLNNQIFQDDIRSLKSEIKKISEKKSEKELFIISSMDEIKHHISMAIHVDAFQQKILHLNSAKSYTKALFNNLDNIFDARAQGLSTIRDCISFNNPELVISKALTLLLNIIDDLKNETLTQEAIEIYISKIYQKGLRLFGQKGNNKFIQSLLPDDMNKLIENLSNDADNRIGN